MEKKKNATLPALRVTSDLAIELEKCLDVLNTNPDSLTISLPELRRLAYSRLIAEVLSGNLNLGFINNRKIKKTR